MKVILLNNFWIWISSFYIRPPTSLLVFLHSVRERIGKITLRPFLQPNPAFAEPQVCAETDWKSIKTKNLLEASVICQYFPHTPLLQTLSETYTYPQVHKHTRHTFLVSKSNPKCGNRAKTKGSRWCSLGDLVHQTYLPSRNVYCFPPCLAGTLPICPKSPSFPLLSAHPPLALPVSCGIHGSHYFAVCLKQQHFIPQGAPRGQCYSQIQQEKYTRSTP